MNENEHHHHHHHHHHNQEFQNQQNQQYQQNQNQQYQQYQQPVQPPQPHVPGLFDTAEGVIAGLVSGGLTHMTENRNDGILEHGTEAAGAAWTGYNVAHDTTLLGKVGTTIEGTILTEIAVKAEEWFEGKK